MAPPAGLEPATYGLTVRRSTNWTKGELFFQTVYLKVENGADYRNRTGDLLITSQLLYLLS